MLRKSCQGKCLAPFPNFRPRKTTLPQPPDERRRHDKSADADAGKRKNRNPSSRAARFLDYARTARTSISLAARCRSADSGRPTLWTAWARVAQI